MRRENISWSIISRGLLSVVVLLAAAVGMADDIRDDPVYREAIEKFENSDWKGAHRLFKRLHESYPDDPTILNNLAVVAVKLNQPELAIGLLEHAILSHPTLSVNYKNLRILYNYRAAQEYKKALSLDSLKLSAPELSVIGITKQPEDSDTEQIAAAKLILDEPAVEKPLVEEGRPTAAAEEQIANSLQQWTAAWSRQDLNAYFNSYIKDYRPRSGTAHLRWRKLREARIVTPQFINIRISNLSIKQQDDNNAAVTFKQHYQSNLLNSAVIKELRFYKTEYGWKIKSERVVNPS